MLRRLKNFIARPIAAPGIAQLYRACVDRARDPFFYGMRGVPDTVDGRFDMLTLHVFLALRRLKGHPAEAQQLVDILFADMDRNLREMGVSDIRIGKRMKPLLEAFYGRAAVYAESLAENGEAALAEALRRNVYDNAPEKTAVAQSLAGYVRAADGLLARQGEDDILAGKILFPES